MGTLARNLTTRVGELIDSFRVVVLGGARQTGKTTLVRDLLGLPDGSRFTFDDEATLRRATDGRAPRAAPGTAPRPAG